MAKVVMNTQFLDLINTGTVPATPVWSTLGVTFTAYDESPSAQTEAKAYIVDASTTTTTVSYQTAFAFTADLSDDPVIDEFYEICTRQKIGSDAVREFIRVELWRAGAAAGSFRARRYTAAIAVDTVTRPGAAVSVVSGNVNVQGSMIDGEWNGTTFTATP